MTPQQVADYLGISPSTLAAWRSAKRTRAPRIAYLKVGGTIRYRWADVQAYLKRPTAYLESTSD
jgi:excisionase family DNA binding protein